MPVPVHTPGLFGGDLLFATCLVHAATGSWSDRAGKNLRNAFKVTVGISLLAEELVDMHFAGHKCD